MPYAFSPLRHAARAASGPLCAFLLLCAAVFAADGPARPRLIRTAKGDMAGGYPVATDGSEIFALFTASADGGAVHPLGTFNGGLAGIASSPDGGLLALTRDGSLAAYGDDPRALARPDDSRHMLDLAWSDGPLALSYDDGSLWLARPDDDMGWKMEANPVISDPDLEQAALLPFAGELHIFWSARAADMSRGALRHLVFREGRWLELEPAPLGDLAAFTVFPDATSLKLIASTPDLLGDSAPRLSFLSWSRGAWSPDPRLRRAGGERLSRATAFAGATDGDDAFWWLADTREGVVVGNAAADSSRRPARAPFESLLAEGVPADSLWTRLASLATLAALVLLLLIYCRRSRLLSRVLPGRPPDIFSRASALAVDWMLVSVVMTAYHFAAGDVRIYHELMTLRAMNEMFWMNLGALSLFAAICEGLYGQTPGKRLAGLRVRSALGGPPTFVQALLRNVLRGADMFPILFPGLLGLVAAMLNVRRQRFGDIVAATVVRRHTPLRGRKVILASASPRRRELLEALGLDLRVEPPEIDEESVQGENPSDTARLLAEAKARKAVGNVTSPLELVVAADTMVVVDEEILGKPRDAADAVRMLELLSGRSHTVYTGVSVWDPATGQGMSDVEQTEVEFHNLSRGQIEEYVASGDPMDKAGAYGIQSGFLVKQIRGSLSNVAGLPMEMLRRMFAMLDS